MKTSINKGGILSTLFYFILFGMILSSCENDNELTPSIYDFSVDFDDQKFEVTTQKSLNNLVKSVINKKEVVIKNAKLETATDSEGEFQVLKANYEVEDKVVNLFIPLAPIQNNEDGIKSNVARYLVLCTMSCTAQKNCSGCIQTIITKCKEQNCTCSAGTSGCDSSITFPG